MMETEVPGCQEETPDVETRDAPGTQNQASRRKHRDLACHQVSRRARRAGILAPRSDGVQIASVLSQPEAGL